MKNEIISEVSNQIGIQVISKYQREHSNPKEHKYLFAYQIKITNHSDNPVQLLIRKWFIFDSTGKQTIVNGDGVVGKMPILESGKSFEYVSCCPLESPIGFMKGEYEFNILDKNETFTSFIPKFHLISPDVLN